MYFTLTAKNGGAEGREVTVNTETLKLGVGLTPFLSIPNNQLRATDGQAVTVYWTSNLCDKNGSAETTFYRHRYRRHADRALQNHRNGYGKAARRQL